MSSLALSFWLSDFDFATAVAQRLATSRTEETQEQLRGFVELLESPAGAPEKEEKVAFWALKGGS